MQPSVSNISAVILAGGFGTRIKHLLGELPKPMAPVAGRPFVEWVARYLARQGVTRAVLSTGHLAETIERHFQNAPVAGMNVSCVAETSPLGTGGGVAHAIRTSGETPAAWLVLNGDSLVFADLREAAAALADDSLGGVIIGREVPDTSRYGTIISHADGTLARFEEKRPGRGLINAGVYLFRHSLVEKFPAQTPLSMEKEIFPALLARGVRFKVLATSAPFLDIGTPESLPQADGFIAENRGQFAAE
ncbi:MAG: nucleotidyltransferase family protein [Verrucomicrobia bacterium]|nr:nucleotidyltransferase family protein [Verrucomicrobiota bacterium]